MKKIAVLTSGGDAPGMNAAIRAVVRSGIDNGFEMFGVLDGYSGLIQGRFTKLTARTVGGIIQQAGTILGSDRSPEFETAEGRAEALKKLEASQIEGLIVIGGNGTQTGAHLFNLQGFPVIGIASTIDNDLLGSEMTIGVDTALNIALESIDRLKVTASAHRRAIIVEVMGRKCGYLALMAGVTGGAEAVLIPEIENNPEEIAQIVLEAYRRQKKHALIVVAEGSKYNAEALAQYFEHHQQDLGFKMRVTILGHVQRGGVPTVFDRFLATQFGIHAIQLFLQKQTGVLVGIDKNQIISTPLADIAFQTKTPDLGLLKMAKMLAK